MKTKATINRLILVGNGLDLSLGLKTRYEDFLFWYFKNFIIKCLENKNWKRTDSGDPIYSYNDDKLFYLYTNRHYFFSDQEILNIDKAIKDYDAVKNFFANNKLGFKKKFKSDLFSKIFNDTINGWVDIEKVYFDLLKSYIKTPNGPNIIVLNNDLETIKDLLKEYLKTIDYSNTVLEETAHKYLTQFVQKTKHEEFIENFKNEEIPQVESIYFLNFNYTLTLSNMLKHIRTNSLGKFDDHNIELVNIHGELNEDTPLIFGYGDEMDSDYKQIEELNNNRFFDNIKSFKYAQNGKYRNLLRFLNSNDFQVYIYGHSCGLSDRLMLNEIFEHGNCKSIRVFFYNDHEFTNKIMDISRHFNSNKLMRQRIVEYNVNDKIPQIEN